MTKYADRLHRVPSTPTPINCAGCGHVILRTQARVGDDKGELWHAGCFSKTPMPTLEESLPTQEEVREKEHAHGAASEQFMRHHYGASGFVDRSKTENPQKDAIAALKAIIELDPPCPFPPSDGRYKEWFSAWGKATAALAKNAESY